MRKSILALLLAFSMLATMLSGCGGNNASSVAPAPASSAEESPPSEVPAPAPEDSTPAAEPETSAAEESALEEAPVEYATMAEKYAAMSHDTNEAYKELEDGVGTEISYPLADGDTLTMWRVFSAFIWSGLMDSYADMPTLPIIEQATGVNMKFIECSDSAAYEQFNLTIATGDYPDLMAMDYYSGGVTAAYEDDVIIDLTDLVDENMPNYKTLIDTMDDYTKKASTPTTTGFCVSGLWPPTWSPSRA